MARMTSRKDPIASFIWTAGAADMVIGGVGERGSLFALGLLTVGAGLLVRWLRQQRYERSMGAGQGEWISPLRSQFSGDSPFSASGLSVKARGVSAFLARQWQSSGMTPSSRSRRSYSAAARPGFRANRFVDSAVSRPRPDFRNEQSVQQRAHLIQRPAGSPPSERRPRKARAAGSDRDRTAANRGFQGPPLNLPPAPRGRSRRGRRIY